MLFNLILTINSYEAVDHFTNEHVEDCNNLLKFALLVRSVGPEPRKCEYRAQGQGKEVCGVSSI